MCYQVEASQHQLNSCCSDQFDWWVERLNFEPWGSCVIVSWTLISKLAVCSQCAEGENKNRADMEGRALKSLPPQLQLKRDILSPHQWGGT